MKKIVYGFLALFMLASVSSNLSFATEANQAGTNGRASDLGRNDAWGFDNANNKSGDFLAGGAGGIGGHTTTDGSKILDSVKKFINWALGMLATVALVLYIHRHKQQVKDKNTITTK